MLPRRLDDEKAESARIFYGKWLKVREDRRYLAMKKAHQARYG